MGSLVSALQVSLLVVCCANAQKVGLKSELGFTCWNAAFKYNFDCPIELPYNKRCASEDFLATVFECINTYGTCAPKRQAAYQFVHDQCFYWGNTTISVDEMERLYAVNTARVITEDQIYNPTEPLTAPVRVPPILFDQQLRGAKTTVHHYALGDQFGLAMVVYWSIVVGLAMLFNMWKLVDREYVNTLFGRRFTCWFRYWCTMPALGGYKHYVPHKFLWGVFSINSPTRGQTIIISGFVVINIVSLVINYDIDSPKPLIFVENAHKVMRYLANRTGIIALRLLPVTVLFACRNSPLIVLTGWNYQTFQIYHRWCARMMAMHAVIHGTLITVYSCRESIALWKWRNIFNWPAGNTGAYCMILMLVISLKAVRRRTYELFLCAHQFLFLVVLIAISVHISDYGWQESIYVTLGFYAIEYLTRLYKVVRSGGIQSAELELVTDDVYRVTITNPRRWRFSEGQYVYLRVLTPKYFIQAHPFSIMGESSKGLELMIKAKNGLTAELLQQLRDAPTHSLERQVVIEGPYGHGTKLRNYKNLFILAGGVGITALYAHATSKSRDACQNLTLVWVVKSRRHLRAYTQQYYELLKLGPKATISVYITSPDLDALEFSDEEDLKAASINDTLLSGRPPLESLLHNYFETIQQSTAVCACGPPSFLDSTRAAVRASILEAPGVVDYFEEGLGW